MNIACIAAAGIGARTKSALPKQFVPIAGKPMIVYSVEKFLSVNQIDYILIAVSEKYLNYAEKTIGEFISFSEKISLVKGGETRGETIKSLLSSAEKFFRPAENDIILTHDAARPFVSEKIIIDNILAAEKYGVCGTAVPASDTIFRVNNGEISSIPPRNEMYAAQTPQSFKFGLYKQAMKKIERSQLEAATDCCKIFQSCGFKVNIVEGSAENFKITSPTDFALAENVAAKIFSRP